MRLDLAITDGLGRRLTLPTSRAVGLTFSTGRNGHQDLTAFLPMPDAAAFTLATTAGLRAIVTEAGSALWEGRVEDLRLVNGGVQVAALGEWRSFDDDLYTALWSDTRYERWQVVTQQYTAIHNPDQFEIDTENRLFIGLQKNTTYGAVNPLGALVYRTPNRSARVLQTFTASYELLAPASFTAQINAEEEGVVSPIIAWSLNGNGAIQSGTFNLNFSGRSNLRVILYANTPGTFAGENGSNYLSLTDIRVTTTTITTVTADAIVRDIRSQINALNPGTLSTSNRLIVNPILDLNNALYQDDSPQDILVKLAEAGDTSGQQYEVGVWGREVFFRPAGSGGAEWAVDASELEVEQSLDGLVNATYGTYEDAGGRTLRTADQTSPQSITRYGRTRRRRQDVDTTSATIAATVAATATAATSTPVPRARVRVRRIATPAGATVPGYRVRAGDTIAIRNLTPTAGDVVDRVRVFRVAETQYDADSDTVEITPETPTPDIDYQIALTLRAARGG